VPAAVVQQIRRPPSCARGKNAERRVERPRPGEHPVEIGQRKQRRDPTNAMAGSIAWLS
jgi:hypothetical protein